MRVLGESFRDVDRENGYVKGGPWYMSFVHEFQRWHCRLMPKGRERADACTFLSAVTEGELALA